MGNMRSPMTDREYFERDVNRFIECLEFNGVLGISRLEKTRKLLSSVKKQGTTIESRKLNGWVVSVIVRCLYYYSNGFS